MERNEVDNIRIMSNNLGGKGEDRDFLAKVSGDYGEFKLSSVLKGLPEEFHVIDDVMLKTKKGSTQLDHIVVSPYGIFVVETKNYKGMIFGDERGQVWTQVLRGRGHFTVYNPLFQNQGHINNLSRSARIPIQLIRGIIVFTSEEVNLANVRCPCCFNIEGAYNYLLFCRNEVVMNEQLVWKAIKRIDRANINSYENEMKHIKYVKNMRGDKGR